MLERALRSRATKPTIALNMDNVVLGVDEEVRGLVKRRRDTLEDHFWRTVTEHLMRTPQHSDQQHPRAKRLTRGACPGEEEEEELLLLS